METFDPSAIRSLFPSLSMMIDGRPAVYFDNPGGTQVPQVIIDAIGEYLRTSNSNSHGAFLTSQRTDAVAQAAHQAGADFLNAARAEEIAFGPNMTTLTFAISRAIGRTLHPGDEIVITRLDHDANIAPWLALQEQGAVIRWVDIRPETCTLDLDSLDRAIGPRTKIVAVGYASNAVGTINPVRDIVERAHAVAAWTYIDAVHYGPHGPIDVQALGCDFLVCSSYKFFGPHLGMLYGRYDLLAELPAYKVRPAGDELPSRFETGTPNYEALNGLVACVDYLAGLGRKYGSPYADRFPALSGRRLALKSGMAAIQNYEQMLIPKLISALQEVPALRIYGLTDPADYPRRVPTVSFTLAGHRPREVAEFLGKRGIFAWDGNFYALAITERLGLEPDGLVRIGMAHYNTVEEIARLKEALLEL